MLVSTVYFLFSCRGFHRPLWPVYGEYLYCPPQRWVHSLEVSFSIIPRICCFTKQVYMFMYMHHMHSVYHFSNSMVQPFSFTTRVLTQMKLKNWKLLRVPVYANMSLRLTDHWEPKRQVYTRTGSSMCSYRQTLMSLYIFCLQPFAIVTWGCRIRASFVDIQAFKEFIRVSIFSCFSFAISPLFKYGFVFLIWKQFLVHWKPW